jgi:hypothetical protein
MIPYGDLCADGAELCERTSLATSSPEALEQELSCGVLTRETEPYTGSLGLR